MNTIFMQPRGYSLGIIHLIKWYQIFIPTNTNLMNKFKYTKLIKEIVHFEVKLFYSLKWFNDRETTVLSNHESSYPTQFPFVFLVILLGRGALKHIRNEGGGDEDIRELGLAPHPFSLYASQTLSLYLFIAKMFHCFSFCPVGYRFPKPYRRCQLPHPSYL